MNDKLEEKLSKYERKIESLTQTITDLQIENKNLQIKNLEHQKNRNYFINIENNNKILSEDQKMKGIRIKDLEDEIIKVTENCKEESRNIQKNLESEILYYKGINETSLSKIYAADKIIKLNETQHNIILKLEKKIDEIKSENEEKMNKLQLAHERHYLKLKKQMLDYIKATQKDMSKNNEYNLELNTKFNILYKNQMMNELENQSRLIQDLLKTKERHEKIIFVLQQEIQTHKKVEEIITKKKNTYFHLAKKSNDNNESKDEMSNNKIPLISTTKNGNNCLTERNNSINRSIFHIMNKKEYHDYKSLEKIYKELLDEFKEIKNKYNTLKDREKMNKEKYIGFINLFNEALDKMMEDEEIKTKKNIYININEINKGNFENLSKEEKYFILVKLLDNLLSLVQISENDEKLSSLKDNIKNVEFKRSKPILINRNKYFDTPIINKPFYGVKSNNFYNISTNNESNTNTNEKQHFVSLFGDDFILFGKNVLPETNSVNSVKKDRENFLNISERNKKMSVISEKNKVNIKCSKYKKIEIRDYSEIKKKLSTEENGKSINDYKKIKIMSKRRNTFDKTFIRELIV